MNKKMFRLFFKASIMPKVEGSHAAILINYITNIEAENTAQKRAINTIKKQITSLEDKLINEIYDDALLIIHKIREILK